MTEQQTTGWYPDPSDPNAEIYWDGTRWHGRRQKFIQPAASPAASPTPPSPSTPVPTGAMLGIGGRLLNMDSKALSTAAAILGLLLVFGFIATECSRSLDSHGSQPRADAPTTTLEPPSTTSSTTVSLIPAPPSFTPPAMADDVIAKEATEWLVKYWRANDGQLAHTGCWPTDLTDCWIKHVTKLDMYDKKLSLGETFRTLRLYIDDSLSADQRLAVGREAADWVSNAIANPDASDAPANVARAVRQVEAVTGDGQWIATGTGREVRLGH